MASRTATGRTRSRKPRAATEKPAEVRAAISDLMVRAAFAARTGLSFQDSTGTFKRDLYKALGYKDKLEVRDFRGRYERGGVAERIVEAYPKATWSGGAYLQEDPDPDITTPFEEAAVELFERVGLWSRLMRADILAGLGQYAVLLIGAEGDTASELNRVRGPESILYLTPLPEDLATIESFEENTANPRFGLPLYYQLKLGKSIARRAHWSRVIHVSEGLLVDDVYGKPRLRACWNNLDDLDKIIGGGAEATWKRADPGMQLDIDPEYELSANDEEALSDQVDEYIHGFRRVLQTRGSKINLLSNTVPVISANADAVLQLIAATTGIPQRILTGSERGELASTQDRGNWADRVAERRVGYAVPLIRSITNRFIEIGALPKPNSYDVLWSEIDSMSETEKANVTAMYSQANASQKNAEGMLVITANEIRDRVLRLGPLPEPEPEELEDEETDPGSEGPEGSGDSEDDPVVADQPDEDDDPGERAAKHALRIAARSPKLGDDWRAAARAARRHRARLTVAMLAVWASISARVDASEIESLLAFGNLDGVVRQVATARSLAYQDSSTVEPYRAELLAAMTDAGRAVTELGRESGSLLRAAQFDMAFDGTSETAVAWALAAAYAELKYVEPWKLEALRQLVAAALEGRMNIRQVAQLVKESATLRPDQLARITRFAERGANAAQLTRLAERMKLQWARMVARTAINAAANAGQRETWIQAIDKGYLPKTQMRVWITTLDGRQRDTHNRLHGKISSVYKPFDRGDGILIEPGQEPNCRCTHALITMPARANPLLAAATVETEHDVVF